MSAGEKHASKLSINALTSIGRLLSGSTDRPAAIRGALEVLREALGADCCGVLLPGNRAGWLNLAFFVTGPGSASPAIEIPVSGSFSGDVLRGGRPIVIAEASAPGLGTGADAEGVPVGAYLGIPLNTGGEITSILRATRSKSGFALTPEQRDLLSLAASLVGASVSLERLSADTGQAQAELADIIESLHPGVLSVDASLRVRLWNRRLVSLLCLAPDRIAVGKAVSAVLPPALWRDAEPNVEETASVGSETRLQCDLNLPGGEVLPVEVRTAPLHAGESARCGVLISVTDMSLQRELATLRRLENLETNFLSMVSHELRTPLTSIKGAAGLLAGGADADLEQRQSLLRIVQNNTERLIRLVDDLLDVVTIEQNTLTLNMEPLDLRTVVEAAVADAVPAAERNGCIVSTDLVSQPIRGDAKRLRQVFAQLLGNAVKFSRRGGEIVVRLGAADGMARVTFRDCGPGIPESARDKVFQKFFQVEDPMTRSAGGTGIGLHIAKTLVDAHGGRIRVLDSGDWGTEMAVDLPVMNPVSGRLREADGVRWLGK